ncbi:MULTISPECIES: hypothetical protein [Actinosynnema]|uniref:hypothetical protein n=1 Tax=Actinosynnema TaxID=40566 RepID=UPI0020A33118|nr:hypothetical protein [Actinosynnema pretiosum]
MGLTSKSPLYPSGPVADLVQRRMRAVPFLGGAAILGHLGLLIQMFSLSLHGRDTGSTWFLLAFAVALVVPVVLGAWLRVRGHRRPDLWVPAALITLATILLLGVLPVAVSAVNAVGLAEVGAHTLLSVVVSLLFVLIVAHSLSQSLTAMPAPELGSTGYPLTVPLRTTHVEPRIDGALHLTDRAITWSAHRASRWWDPRPGAKATLPLDQIHDVTPADQPTPTPLLTLPDGTTLDTTPGPVVRVTTVTGQVVVLPVSDAALYADLIQRRRQYVHWAAAWTR